MRFLGFVCLFVAAAGSSSAQTILNANRPGGLYHWKNPAYTYPNGEKTGPSEMKVMLSLLDAGGVLFSGPGTAWFMSGERTDGEFTVRGPLFGSDFSKAPESIQAAISGQRLSRQVKGRIQSGSNLITGTYLGHYARWRGNELLEVAGHPIPFTMERTVYRVSGLEIKTSAFESARADAARRRQEARSAYVAANEAFQQSKRRILEWTPKVKAAEVALQQAKQAHLAAVQAGLTVPANLQNAEYRNLTGRRTRNEARLLQIDQRLKYLLDENTPAAKRAMGPLVQEADQLKKDNRTLDSRIANLENRLGIKAHRDRAKASTDAAYDAIWKARRDLVRNQSERDLAARLADRAMDDVVSAHDLYRQAINAYEQFEGADIPVIQSVTLNVPGVAYRAELFGPQDALQKLDRQIREVQKLLEESAEIRRKCRTRFDEQKPRIEAAELGLARGQWYSALSQAGIEFAVGFYELFDAFATGGFVGLGAETAKKLAEAYFGGTDYIVTSQVIPPGGVESQAMALTHMRALETAGKKIGDDALQNLWKATLDTDASFFTVGFQAKQLGEAEAAYRRMFAAMVDKSPDIYKGRWSTRLKELFTGPISPDQALDRIRSEGVAKMKEIGELDKRLADTTLRNGWRGVAREFGKAYAKGLLIDTGKAMAKQAVADYFEGQAWQVFQEEAFKMKAFSHALLTASTHYWETRDMLDGLYTMRAHMAKTFNPTSGMLTAEEKPFYFVDLPTVSLTLTPNSTFQPSKVSIRVSWGKYVLEPVEGTSLTFKTTHLAEKLSTIQPDEKLTIEFLPKTN